MGFRNCRRARFKCSRAPAACHHAPTTVAKPASSRLRPFLTAKSPHLSGFETAPSSRLRPFVAAKVMFYRVSNLPPGRLQMPPCSCSLPPTPKKGGKARLRPCMAAKVIFYRVSNLPPGKLPTNYVFFTTST